MGLPLRRVPLTTISSQVESLDFARRAVLVEGLLGVRVPVLCRSYADRAGSGSTLLPHPIRTPLQASGFRVASISEPVGQVLPPQ